MGFDSIKAHQQFKDGKLSKHAVFSQPGLCMVDVYCARPGQSQPVHGHAHATKCYAVIEGRARITIGDDFRVRVHPSLRNTEYQTLEHKPLRLPVHKAERPSITAIRAHRRLMSAAP